MNVFKNLKNPTVVNEVNNYTLQDYSKKCNVEQAMIKLK